MKDVEFKSLDLSLVKPLVLFQKKFFQQLNGNIFYENEIIKNLKNKYLYIHLSLIKKSIVGFLIAQKVLDFFEIHSLFVSPDYRRGGIAMRLLNEFIDKCKDDKIDRILLEVMEHNNAAKKLYLKNEFLIYGERKGYYLIGDKRFNGILMKLELK